MRGVKFVVGFCLLATPVLAQQAPRVEISAGASVQPKTVTFSDVTSFPYFAETARLNGAYDVGDGVAFDIGGRVRVWNRLSAGVAVTSLKRKSQSEITGSFPHPFFFNRDRTGTWTSESLDRTEVGVHLSGAFQVLNQSNLGITVFGGPTFFSFEQPVIENVDVIQSFPYDTIDARLVTGTVDGSTVGFHAGADVGWFFSEHFGVGGLFRFTKGTKKDMRIGDGEPFDLELGGFQGGGGIRLRF